MKNTPNKINLVRLIIFILVFIQGCALIKNDAKKMEDKSQSNASTNPSFSPEQATKNTQIKAGVIKIHRHGPGYDITLDMDATDENIALMMDLPQQKQIEKIKADIYQSIKLVMQAQSLFYKKEYVKANEIVDTSINITPDNPLAYSLKGSILYKLDRIEEAIQAWEKALNLDSSLTEVQTILKKLGRIK